MNVKCSQCHGKFYLTMTGISQDFCGTSDVGQTSAVRREKMTDQTQKTNTAVSQLRSVLSINVKNADLLMSQHSTAVTNQKKNEVWEKYLPAMPSSEEPRPGF